LKERHRVERLLGGVKTQRVGLSVVNDSQMIFGLWSQRADREVVVARRERDQKISVRLLLHGDGLRVESEIAEGKRTVVLPDLKAIGRL
jgi:hypothetical protein